MIHDLLLILISAGVGFLFHSWLDDRVSKQFEIDCLRAEIANQKEAIARHQLEEAKKFPIRQ